MQLSTLKQLGSLGSGGTSSTAGATGPAGPTGPTGPIGPAGTAGPETGGIVAFAYVNGILYPFNGTNKQYIFKTMNVTTIMLSVDTAAVGADIVVRINKNGSELTRLSLSSGILYRRFSGLSLGFAADDAITLDVVSCGTDFPGKNLTVQMII